MLQLENPSVPATNDQMAGDGLNISLKADLGLPRGLWRYSRKRACPDVQPNSAPPIKACFLGRAQEPSHILTTVLVIRERQAQRHSPL